MCDTRAGLFWFHSYLSELWIKSVSVGAVENSRGVHEHAEVRLEVRY